MFWEQISGLFAKCIQRSRAKNYGSPYSRIMKLKMWGDADEYREWEQLTTTEQEQYGKFGSVHVDAPLYEREVLVLVEREEYYNLNYLWIMQEMEDVKRVGN